MSLENGERTRQTKLFLIMLINKLINKFINNAIMLIKRTPNKRYKEINVKKLPVMLKHSFYNE